MNRTTTLPTSKNPPKSPENQQPITANDYQILAVRTLQISPKLSEPENQLVYLALGLVGESGELADTIKKVAYHKHQFNAPETLLEIGDVCWYLACICEVLHINLSCVMEHNIEKLRKRYPNGYNPEDSQRRADKNDHLPPP
jgi:NTP pyrophosphatase (non-canonical NTP hydrolase)